MADKNKTLKYPSPRSNLSDEALENFVQLLSGCQTGLYAYAAKLLGDVQEAHNIVQQTNLVLWQKADEFEPGTSFLAWASKVVYFQVLAHVRDTKRQRLVFDEALVHKLAAAQAPEDVDERRIALRACLENLPKNQRVLIHQRYEDGESITTIAAMINKSQGAVRNALMRIRQGLARCIMEKLEESS